MLPATSNGHLDDIDMYLTLPTQEHALPKTVQQTLDDKDAVFSWNMQYGVCVSTLLCSRS